MEEQIKKYLDGFSSKDEFFKSKYDEKKIPDCVNYIFKQAEEMANGKNAIGINDETVFKWARDYFIEGIAQREEEEKERRKAEELARKEKEENEDPTEFDRIMEESRKKRKEEEAKRAMEERDKREHKDGQTTIFDLLGGC